MARKAHYSDLLEEEPETEEQQPETDKAPEPFPVGSRAKVVKVTDVAEWPEFMERIGRTGEVTGHTGLGTTVLRFEDTDEEYGFFDDELEAVSE